ncbi:MAG: hypothetical protein AAGJ28_03925 [Pseudomonadota bacterium]
MGWPFDEASWNSVEGAYYSAIGSEMLWLVISAALCVIALVVGLMHEKSAYRREEDRSGR